MDLVSRADSPNFYAKSFSLLFICEFFICLFLRPIVVVLILLDCPNFEDEILVLFKEFFSLSFDNFERVLVVVVILSCQNFSEDAFLLLI